MGDEPLESQALELSLSAREYCQRESIWVVQIKDTSRETVGSGGRAITQHGDEPSPDLLKSSGDKQLLDLRSAIAGLAGSAGSTPGLMSDREATRRMRAFDVQSEIFNCVIRDWQRPSIEVGDLAPASIDPRADIAALFPSMPFCKDSRAATAMQGRVDDVAMRLDAAPVSDPAAQANGLSRAVRSAGAQAQAGASVTRQARYVLARSCLMQAITRASATLSNAEQQAHSDRHGLIGELDSLSSIADMLALAGNISLASLARAHRRDGRVRTANRLLRAQRRIRPHDVESILEYARLRGTTHGRSAAIDCLQQGIADVPNEPRLQHQLGLALMRKRRYTDARTALEAARLISSDDEVVSSDLERLTQLEAWYREAAKPSAMPAIGVSRRERSRGTLSDQTIDLAAHLYRRHGTLLIESAFDVGFIDSLNREFQHRYGRYFSNRKHEDALQIGDRRFQVSLVMEGLFNDAALYANPFVLGIMTRLLGRQVIVGSTVCATSLPGARDQHLHKDHRALFTTDVDDTPSELPPVAITTMIPLVDIDSAIGGTLVKKGSHRCSRRDSADLSSQCPEPKRGSCFLMDLALSHKGLGNRTERVRPIINMVYQQRWFVDNKNFSRQPPLHFPSGEYSRVPEHLRRLFDWARQPGAQVID